MDEAPLHDAVPYFSIRAFSSSVCDDKRRSIHIHGPWPGSAHDNRIRRKCKVNVKKDELFLEREYVPWDSTFSASGSIHQGSANQHSLSNEQEFFNSKLASPLALSEHCIGALKIAFLF